MRVSVEREGPRVVLALRADSGARATLNLHHRSAAALAVNVAAASSGDEDASLDCELRGELETGDPKP